MLHGAGIFTYMLAIFGVYVGKYSISGASGHVCFGKRTYPKFTYSSPTVMAMNISYNWLFQWDEIHSINGVISTYNWYFGP